MDLSRWSLKNLGHALGHVLDSDLPTPASIDGDDVRDQFEINESSDDLAREMALVRPGAAPEKILAAFMPFFEGGLCLRGDSTLSSLFLFGQTFTPEAGAVLEIGTSRLGGDRVYRMDLAPILKSLGLPSFFRLEGASAFAFRVSGSSGVSSGVSSGTGPASDVTFVLFDNRPHPWQVFALENAFFAARETFARVSGARATRGLFK